MDEVDAGDIRGYLLHRVLHHVWLVWQEGMNLNLDIDTSS